MKTEQEIKDEIQKTKNANAILQAHYANYEDIETAIDIHKNKGYIEALEFVLDEIEE